ncbi:CLUMA_CG019529, isoform A [Clunio marinus]|uniref:CLUMA_CG019529, isoform A n=1 Tax=Clunio marinus TaxID=568069 RepID=A0A1J1J276_9DIPT|nr:CLUMA_CG019529, isoform A [Clunio marinus]
MFQQTSTWFEAVPIKAELTMMKDI